MMIEEGAIRSAYANAYAHTRSFSTAKMWRTIRAPDDLRPMVASMVFSPALSVGWIEELSNSEADSTCQGASIPLEDHTASPMRSTIVLDVLLLALDSGAPSRRLNTAASVIRVEHASGGANEGFAVVLEGLNLGEGGSDLRASQ